MITVLAQIVLVVIIAGAVVWGIDKMPALDETFKQVAKVIIIVAVVIFAILRIASLFGVHLLPS